MIIKDLIQAFQKGYELKRPDVWKNRAIGVNVIAGFLVALLGIGKAFGYDLGLSHDTVQGLAEGVFALATLGNAVVHVVTSKKVGLPPKPGPADPPGPGSVTGA